MGKKKSRKSKKSRLHERAEHRPGKLGTKEYENALYGLQVELCKLQDWVKQEGLRGIVVFEGRDAAGKGGVIKRTTERVNPTGARSAQLRGTSQGTRWPELLRAADF